MSYAKWIWPNNCAANDEYADFIATLSMREGASYSLRVASDSNYALYINGKLAEFGQYADYPNDKVIDLIDITKHLKAGENRLCFIVWYYGIGSTSTYVPGKAGLYFEISENDKVILVSDENILSRTSKGYVSHEARLISNQLGFTWHYDAKNADTLIETGEGDGFAPSIVQEGISTTFRLRPVKKLVLEDRIDGKVCMTGDFRYDEPTDKAEVNMQYASMAYRHYNGLGFNLSLCEPPFPIGNTGSELGVRSSEIYDMDKSSEYGVRSKELFSEHSNGMQKEDSELRTPNSELKTPPCGVFIIIDLHKEVVGFLDFDIELPCDCQIDIGYGEHLVDGRCRTAIRNFSAVYNGVKGRNRYLNPFRRFGCRYVQLFIHAPYAVVHYIGLRPTIYPMVHKVYKSGNLLRDTIYEVAQNTLQQCVHEHYEDCPWREQALYCMDSRNEMLCGYYAFNEFEMPRAAMQLMLNGINNAGLLSICYPCGSKTYIPSFSAVYFIQMQEYIEYSGDTSLAEQGYPTLQALMDTFLRRRDERGLIASFHEEGAWNFYEWSDGLGGEIRPCEKGLYETCLNAMISLALKHLAKTARALGKESDAADYTSVMEKLNKAIAANSYNEETKLFENYCDKNSESYNVLTNALCTLCGAADGLDKTNILRILATNGKDNLGYKVIPDTLSMNTFRFDALLREDKEKYRSVILDEIDRDSLYMLRQGATALWETIEGESAFHNAGSLCHGWSAMAIYYYETLCGGEAAAK